MPRLIQTAISDQDGLMFDTENLTAAPWFEIGPRYGIHVDDNFLRGVRGYKPDRVKQVYTQQFDEDVIEDHDYFREEKCQYSCRWIAQRDIPIKRGPEELLICLKGRNIKTAVATASSEDQTQGNIRGTGVGNYFNDYIYGDMIGEAKPDPAIFLLAVRRLGVELEVCVVLGDSSDGTKAVATGSFNPVMIPDQDQPDGEIHKLLAVCCDSLTDIIDLFETGKLSLQQL